MKKEVKWLITMVCITSSIALSGCSSKSFSVNFQPNYAGCETMDSIAVNAGKKVEQPITPTREGYQFTGWYKDTTLTEEWDFDKDKVKSDMELYAGWDLDTHDEITKDIKDKDFSSITTAGSQEAAYDYTTYFLPTVDGISQPYVGDTMPYYEDGVYYLYYLKEGGDSYNHSIYLTTTKDFVSYEEQDEVVLEANRNGGQDGWIGTGSVVKVGKTYYFFYTGHASSSCEYQEKIMVAKSDTLTSFEKVEGWEITPDASLGQRLDFRDPQAYYDEETNEIVLTITASQEGIARIIKYTLSADLQSIKYDGIIFTDPIGEVYNLECSDTFQIGDMYYLTYSAQDDTLWYASAKEPYGPYSAPIRLDGKLFYAAKHVGNGEDNYMVGWARRSESPSSTTEVSGWGGNLMVQKVTQLEDGSLILTPVDSILNQYNTRRELLIPGTSAFVASGSQYSYQEVFTAYESFKLTGTFSFAGTGGFGLAFDYGRDEKEYKLITIDPKNNVLRLEFGEGAIVIAEKEVCLDPDTEYSFTYIQEGSVGTFYINDTAALTVRIYGATGKSIRLFSENNSVLFTSLRQYTK